MVLVSTDPWGRRAPREDLLGEGIIPVSDPEGRILDDWGLRDVSLGRVVSRPAAYLLDGEGRVRWRHLPPDWRHPLTPIEYLNAFHSIDADVNVDEVPR